MLRCAVQLRGASAPSAWPCGVCAQEHRAGCCYGGALLGLPAAGAVVRAQNEPSYRTRPLHCFFRSCYILVVPPLMVCFSYPFMSTLYGLLPVVAQKLRAVFLQRISTFRQAGNEYHRLVHRRYPARRHDCHVGAMWLACRALNKSRC